MSEITSSGLSFFPKWDSNKRARASVFACVEQLIDQVCLSMVVTSNYVCKKMSENLCSL